GNPLMELSSSVNAGGHHPMREQSSPLRGSTRSSSSSPFFLPRTCHRNSIVPSVYDLRPVTDTASCV
ncbi:hypothetical protein NDU88_000497, partial [Pleurodeles waltl]